MTQHGKWFELIDSLGVYRDAGGKAVYKPLLTLMVLAAAQNGGENRFVFSEIEKQLAEHMKKFGQKKVVNSLYPFWYLRNDGYWRVEADGGVLEQRQGKSEPKRSELKKKGAYGHVPTELWDALVSCEKLCGELAQKLLDDYWQPSIHDDLVASLSICPSGHYVGGDEQKRCKRFREEVMIAYNHQCALCGFDGKVGEAAFGIEAAHIQARSKKLGNGPDVVTNGLALCSLHHKAFDYGVITLCDDYKIQVSSRLAGNLQKDSAVSKLIRDYEGCQAQTPSGKEPCSQHLQWHRRNVFRA